MKVYQYPKCSTCRKALKWLEEHSVEIHKVDITLTPPSVAELRRVLQLTGAPVSKLFNTSGVSYREGGFKERLKSMTEEDALALLAADGKLIKRPLLIARDVAMVGFQAEQYAARFT